MTTDNDLPSGTPRPEDPSHPPTDPDTEGNPVTPPNPAEAPSPESLQTSPAATAGSDRDE